MGKVITIGREFGSNGRAIARELSEALGIQFYDKELIEMAAKKSKLSDEDLAEIDETRANPWIYSSVGYQVGSGYTTVEPINDLLYQAEASVIRDVAESEDCIIVGRCSDYVLKDKIDSRHVFVYAPLNYRLSVVMNRDNLNEKKARSVIKKVDKRRRLYYNFYTDRNWNDLRNYDLSLDSSIFSMQDIIGILTEVYETM
jgi:cytidylate kinase